MKYEELNITDDLEHYFTSKEEFKDFSDKVLKKFDDLEKQNFKNINFNINSRYYTEYGEIYPLLDFIFEYERELTQQEIEDEQSKKEQDKINKKITKDLIGKLSSNSIGAIINNEDLKKLYLEGKIII